MHTKNKNENLIEKIQINNTENEEKKLREKKKIEADSTIPILENVIPFFQENKHTPIEAEKFFNYFESNGWLVEGKTKMKNWKDTAKNWMLNSYKYSKPINTLQPNHLHI